MTSAVGGRDSTAGGDHPPVRYGIIGTGMMGCEHILNLMAIDDARVVAVSDPNQTSRDWAVDCAGREPDLAVFADYRDLLALDDLDAVVVATPYVTHVDVLADVLATGLAAAPAAKVANWQDRFVNHLGASAERVDPNASLRLRLDASPRMHKAAAEVTA